MSIKIRNLSKYFITGGERRQVLGDVNLEVAPGEIFGLCGPNGSGKTTLLKILSTLVLPDSGEAFISGRNVINDPEDARSRVGFVYDAERSFYQALSVEENLGFYAGLRGIGGKDFSSRLGRLLEQFNLSSWRKAKMSHCSSGIKQRLAIARALLDDPEALLIDELTRSLDPRSRKEILAYVKEIVVSKNKTCIMVTHTPELEAGFLDRTGYLKDGILTI